MRYIINKSGVTLFIDNKPVKIAKGDKYSKIIKALNLPSSEQESAIRKILDSNVEITKLKKQGLIVDKVNNAVYYNEDKLPDVIASKVFAILNEGLPIDSFAAFWERLMKNPSARATRELYDFLSYRELPLTEDGYFLAYKGVQENFYSKIGNKSTRVLKGTVDESGHILNAVNEEIRVERQDVDDDRNSTCSFGLHAGSLDYAKGYASTIVVVEIDPADVVSVPSDCSHQKLRCCAYKVVSVFSEEIKSTVVDNQQKPVVSASIKERNYVSDRVQKYIIKRVKQNTDCVITVTQIRDAFSPNRPSKIEILDALTELGYSWNQNNVIR